MKKLNVGRIIFATLLFVSVCVLGLKLIEATGISEWYIRIPLYIWGVYLGFDFVWK